MNSLLTLDHLSVAYGEIHALRDVSLEIPSGSIVALIGANGAGKSSLLKAIAGAVSYEGKIIYDGKIMPHAEPQKIATCGISLVPEGRSIFNNLTVLENLKLGSWNHPETYQEDLQRVYQFFPRLQEREQQMAGTLSGGEQQMLTMGRALMTRARLLLLDEPSMGLAPILVREIFSIIGNINKAGVTIFLIEQNATMALRIANQAHLIELGKITLSGTGEELLVNEKVREGYLGGKN
ncbi:MAG: ABC transporter ATP-binding protein [Chthoniobacterales bacterium]|nr:ABC transporter ATP-binding protein [Chthoniobacterales bacterium]